MPFEYAMEEFETNSERTKLCDESGLTISLKGVWPVILFDDERRKWAGSLVLDSSALKDGFTSVSYKLRIHCNKRMKTEVTCSNGTGVMNKNSLQLISYQLPEETLNCCRMYLLVDDVRYHEVPIYKEPNADEFWLSPRKEAKESSTTSKLTLAMLLRPHLKSVMKDLAKNKMSDSELDTIFECSAGDNNLIEKISNEVERRFKESLKERSDITALLQSCE